MSFCWAYWVARVLRPSRSAVEMGLDGGESLAELRAGCGDFAGDVFDRAVLAGLDIAW
jgi:hypothetical protein